MVMHKGLLCFLLLLLAGVWSAATSEEQLREELGEPAEEPVVMLGDPESAPEVDMQQAQERLQRKKALHRHARCGVVSRLLHSALPDLAKGLNALQEPLTLREGELNGLPVLAARDGLSGELLVDVEDEQLCAQLELQG